MRVVWPGSGTSVLGPMAGLDRARWSWQPTRNFHDPDPPLRLESNVYVYEGDGGLAGGGDAATSMVRTIREPGGAPAPLGGPRWRPPGTRSFEAPLGEGGLAAGGGADVSYVRSPLEAEDLFLVDP